MKHERLHQKLLASVRRAYCAHPDMVEFAAFPDRVMPQHISPNYRPVCDVMRGDPDLNSDTYDDAMRAIMEAGPTMHWRETYKESAEGAGFMGRLGCYAVIGAGSPYAASTLRLFVVYMPAGLHYPRHHHPAEEIYLVIAGGARFSRAGAPDQFLSEGQTVFHASNQVHALETTDGPVMCLVAWRNHFDTPPVLVADTDS